MENQNNHSNLIHNLNQSTPVKTFNLPIFILLIILTIFLGIGTGFFVSKIKNTARVGSKTSEESISKKIVGISDKKNFKDKAEGILREGGIDGEGSFHLERPGGQSQNVYLTSTTVDLSSFIGKKVRVWGETFQAEKAGWLMDVGLIEVL